MTKYENIPMPNPTQHPTIAAALCAAQTEMGPVLKDAKNPAFKRDGKDLKYATLQSVIEACMPALNRNGIAVIQPIGEDATGRYVETVLVHSAGTLQCRVPLIVSKNDMQGFGSAVTYARRYGLMAMAGIAPEDDDGNAATKAPPVRHEQEPARVIDDIGAFSAAVSSAGLSLEMASDLTALANIWKGLRRDVQADGAVIRAKDKRKAELSRMETAGPTLDDVNTY